MRIAWFTPLPPMPSGIADYSAELLPYVAQRAEVDVFCPPRLSLRRTTPPGVLVRRPGGHRSEAYDATFHHLGNNPEHEFVYEAARRRPEIAVFHDAVLHHLLCGLTMERRFDPLAYAELLSLDYGPLGKRLANLRRVGLATELEKFVFPLTAHVAREAKGLVVHSADAARRIGQAAPNVAITVIPHHAGEPPPRVRDLTRAEARRRLGLPAEGFVVGHFGFITRPKQPGAVIEGFAALHAEFPDAVLLMVGADHTGGALERLIRGYGLDHAVRRAGFQRNMTRFYEHLRAVDVVVNLRYPSAGESSGTMARAMAEALPTIVNNYASFAEVPKDVALKVEIDGDQGAQVAGHLLHLAQDDDFRARIGRNAGRYAREELDPVRCRDRYLAFAEEIAGRAGADLVRR